MSNSEMIEAYVKRQYIDNYAPYILHERAIPDIRDGLKPGGRLTVWTAFEKGNTWKGKYTKCSDIVGTTLAKYHPHGDIAVYGAMVTMTGLSLTGDDDHYFGPNYPYPFFEGYGNFGSVDGEPPSAMRYPEIRLSRLSQYLFELDLVRKTQDNYLGNSKEPVFLPSKLPFVLLNGISGIAVGVTCDIPPHNLAEVCSAVQLFLKKKKPSLKQVMKHIKGPDHYYGGVIKNSKEEIEEIYRTGKGTFKWGFDYTTDKHKKGFIISITGVPYGMNVGSYMEKIRSEKDVVQVSVDKTGEKLEITVIVKTTEMRKKVVNYLFTVKNAWNVSIRSAYTERFKHKPLVPLLRYWTDYLIRTQKLFFVKSIKKTGKQVKEDLIKIRAIENAEEVIRRVKAGNKAGVIDLLDITEDELPIVWNMSVSAFTPKNAEIIRKRVEPSMEKIREWQRLIIHKNLIKYLYDFMENMKHWSNDRKTTIEM